MFLLLLPALFFAAAGVSALYYRRRWRRRLSVEVAFEKPALDVGETGFLRETVSNKKLLPFWCGSLRCRAPAFIELARGASEGGSFCDAASAFSYETVSRRVPFTARRRGYFRMEGAELHTQDFFFQYRLLCAFPAHAELYVYPEMRRAQRYGPALSRLTGEVLARRHYLEDETRFRGIRDYAPSDSLRRVNWNATAKTGELKVNEFSCTTAQEVWLLLDFDALTAWDSSDLREDILSAAAYLARALLQGGVPVGLAANVEDAATGAEAGLPCRAGAGQDTALRRVLARALPERAARPFSPLLAEVLGRTRASSQYILLSLSAPEELQAQTAALRGSRLHWAVFAPKDARLRISDRRGITLCETP